MNVLKFMLAAFFAICILASVTACNHTTNAPYNYKGIGETNVDLLVPVMQWAF